jgi:hypothetical protein
MERQEFKPKRGNWWYGIGCLVAFVATIGGCVLLLSSKYGPFVLTVGEGVTATEASRQLWHCFVPPSASDVWFESGYRVTRLECALDEEAFLGWCKSRDWTPLAISANEPKFVFSKRKNDPVAVTVGWRFDTTGPGDGAWHVGTYDAGEHRAYIEFIVD